MQIEKILENRPMKSLGYEKLCQNVRIEVRKIFTCKHPLAIILTKFHYNWTFLGPIQLLNTRKYCGNTCKY